ncbi:sec-independent protein translocase [Pedobacter sp. BAL39]|nr:sec-independent protein translocase [Pedobacter sp. BAL39]
MGGGEIMLILAVVLLLFGGKKLPELARGLGKGIREFKDASEGVKREIHRNINSVGIVDDIESVINDTKSSTSTNHYEPGKAEAADHQPADDAGAQGGINLEKRDYAANSNESNSRIETDKTQL